jgi:phosphate transport system protein
MSQHFDRQIIRLKEQILRMGQLVEANVVRAIQAVETVDTQLAWDVIAADSDIDRCEIEVEEECLHTIALYQPVASDMRFVASVLTINKDLERIGDLSVNLAEIAMYLSERPLVGPPPANLGEQCDAVLAMVRQSLEALINLDGALARRVIEADDNIDQLHRESYGEIKRRIRENPDDVDPLINLLLTAKQLERIADHAVNVAEDVIYTAEGKMVRHRHLVQGAARRHEAKVAADGDSR